MIIAIVGPTGVGKTKLSIELAKLLDGEIINADSMQVYKDLNIGTAKIKETEKEGIPHYLFDIKDIVEDYSVCDYQHDARRIMNDIISRGKTVIFVGGTGLYLKACLYDYKFAKEDKVNNYEELTNEEIYNKILKYTTCIDVHLNNRKRLIRLLNKYENNSVVEEVSKPLYDFKIIGLTTDRDKLYETIDYRVDRMFEDGLIDEVKPFYDKGIRSKAIMTGIGYKELYRYFDKELTIDEVTTLIKRNSRRYAKRQYTFFNNQLPVTWFNVNYDDFNKTINEVYDYIKKADK